MLTLEEGELWILLAACIVLILVTIFAVSIIKQRLGSRTSSNNTDSNYDEEENLNMGINIWIRKLELFVRKYGFDNGYNFLSVPWVNLTHRDVVFLSNMPHFPDTIPENEYVLRMICPEDVNEDDFALGLVESPINFQFNKLAHLIGKKPINILSGAATPYRAKKWDDFNDEQKRHTIELGTSFWRKVLKQKSINLIITSGEIASDIVIRLFDAEVEYEIPSGWEDLKLTRYKTLVGKTIISLPDLLEFEILCKGECIDPLRHIFRNQLY